MSKCYINGIGGVSTQNSALGLHELTELSHTVNQAFKPNYRDYIKPVMIRRMASGVKMGVVASTDAMKEAGIDIPEAIVTGTGLGCLQDSEKFLKDIINNEEQYLTPTSFIQSTHNTVGAQIALGLGCKAYNVTYVHGGTSFEAALIDAKMKLEEGYSNVLVGGVDEIGTYTAKLYKSINYIKDEEEIKGSLLDSTSIGSIAGEGAQFFVLEGERTGKSYAEIRRVEIINDLFEDTIEDRLDRILDEEGLDIDGIDLVMLGFNGDPEYDKIYSSLISMRFQHTPQAYYKHLSGEYDTSNSYALWAACHIIRNQQIPEIMRLNEMNLSGVENLLIYNQNHGNCHSFILLKSC